MSAHLDEAALEALATGRDDLVGEAALAHLDGCEACAARVAEEGEAARDASVALRRAMPELDGLDAMIATALEKAPAAELDEALGAAPSRASLWVGAALGGLAAAALAILSAPELGAVGGLGAAGRQALTLLRAADRVVESAVPGSWAAVAVAGLALTLLLALPLRWLLGGKPARGPGLLTGTLAAALLAVLTLPAGPAHAYRVEGEWPRPEPSVTLNVEREPTSEALRQLAEAAGVGVVVHLPDDRPVTLFVRDAPLGEVVEALLGDRDVVVRPSERLFTVREDGRAGAGARDEARTSTADEERGPQGAAGGSASGSGAGGDGSGAGGDGSGAAASAAAGRRAPPAGVADRITLGDDVEIGADERVRGVYTMGGDARVLGQAFGDVVTMGGDAAIAGEVIGNVTTMGGDVRLDEGARVHGDLNAMGGEIEVDDGAVLHGRVLGASDGAPSRAALEAMRHGEPASGPTPGVFRWALWSVLLFLGGLVLLGTSRKRFSTLRGELAARPVRSAVGGSIGLLAGSVLLVVLAVTLIGLPAAFVLGIVLFVGFWLGWTTSAWWLGSVLPLPFLKDRPVLQLAAGVAALFLVGLVPTLGPLLVFGVALAGLGAVLATRFGSRPRRPKRPKHVPTGPFRTGAR